MVCGAVPAGPGAVLGGVLVGLVEQFCGVFIGSTAKDIAADVLLLAVLFLMPNGLLGRHDRKRV